MLWYLSRYSEGTIEESVFDSWEGQVIFLFSKCPDQLCGPTSLLFPAGNTQNYKWHTDQQHLAFNVDTLF
jgi:hypothetical protein